MLWKADKSFKTASFSLLLLIFTGVWVQTIEGSLECWFLDLKVFLTFLILLVSSILFALQSVLVSSTSMIRFFYFRIIQKQLSYLELSIKCFSHYNKKYLKMLNFYSQQGKTLIYIKIGVNERVSLRTLESLSACSILQNYHILNKY